jgi:phage-related protein
VSAIILVLRENHFRGTLKLMTTLPRKNFRAFEGKFFTVEWYYTENGKMPALDYFNELSKLEKAQTLRLIELIATEGKILNIQKFRNEGDGIYAFKPKPHRFLCFFCQGRKIIITNAFVKKKDDLPSEEKDRARRYQQDYISRCEEGDYYEKRKDTEHL